VFTPDIAFAEDSRLGALLLGDLTEPMAELAAAELAATDVGTDDLATDTVGDDTDVPPVAALADVEPAGDADILADLGISTAKLLELCTQEGMLPSDITAEVCQAIGCGDEVEELREA
jgi:putative tRNA adenosine deaminase-associated protein